MKKGKIIYLHTGSNLGNRIENLERVNALIQEHIGKISAKSNIYETAAWGVTDQPSFYNQALKIISDLSPQEVLNKILWIESEKFGRVREEKWAARIIDIDILLFDNQVINTESLIVPHPHMHQRNFVLIPLMEIAGEVEHPLLKETVEDLYWQSEDTLEVLMLE